MGSTQRMRLTERDGSTTVLDRAFAILKAFSHERPELTLAQLVEITQIPRSTTHRLAKQLVGLGGLEYRAGRYRPGLALFELGGLTAHTRVLREIAIPYMQDLYESTHAIVNLGIRSALDVVYVEKIRGHGRARPPSSVGGRLPAHATALGKAILAFSPPEVVAAVISTGLPAAAPHTIRSGRALCEQLDEVRSTRIALDREESAIGIQCAASPIFGPDETVVAAISVTGPAARLQLARIGPLVRDAADKITAALSQTGLPRGAMAGR